MKLSTTFPQQDIYLSYIQIAELFRLETPGAAAQSGYFRDIFKLLYYKGLKNSHSGPPDVKIQFFLF